MSDAINDIKRTESDRRKRIDSLNSSIAKYSDAVANEPAEANTADLDRQIVRLLLLELPQVLVDGVAASRAGADERSTLSCPQRDLSINRHDVEAQIQEHKNQQIDLEHRANQHKRGEQAHQAECVVLLPRRPPSPSPSTTSPATSSSGARQLTLSLNALAGSTSSTR